MKAQSIIKPKKPLFPGWSYNGAPLKSGYPHAAYFHEKTRLCVISAVEVADGILVNEAIPQYHLSMSKWTPAGNIRCSAAEALWILQQFDLEDALEDNHSGLIRSWWRPVADKLAGKDCECKASETAIVEGDFEWRPLTKENFALAKKVGAA